MSLTQFSMVEELAFLVKDNLPCKHLVLSMEDLLVDFLQDDTSLDEELELQPMNPYNRLLLHRLADIFGFSHESIGEGDDRHLVLKRCEDTSIPSILVSEMLWEHDEYQSPVASQLLSRREDGSHRTKVGTLSAGVSLEDREAAYLAARNRIFSTENDDVASLDNNRPRNNPVVARRMIAHALGQKVKHSNQEPPTNELKSQSGQTVGPSLQARPKSNGQTKTYSNNTKVAQNRSDDNTLSNSRKLDTNVSKQNLKEEHLGAAKRMFANALRMHSTKDSNVLSKGAQMKHTDKS